MINDKRVVPIQEVDLITMYGLILKVGLGDSAPEKLAAADIATFSQSTNSKVVLCDEPVKSFNFGSSVTAATVYFVPALDYKGFTKTGATLTVTGDVAADGKTLYSATLSTNALTIAKVGL